MVLFTRAIGKMISRRAREEESARTVKSMKGNGITVVCKEKAYFSAQMAHPSQENGLMESSTVMAIRNGLREQNTREISQRGSKKDTVFSLLPMAAFIRVNFEATACKDTAT